MAKLRQKFTEFKSESKIHNFQIRSGTFCVLILKVLLFRLKFEKEDLKIDYFGMSNKKSYKTFHLKIFVLLIRLLREMLGGF